MNNKIKLDNDVIENLLFLLGHQEQDNASPDIPQDKELIPMAQIGMAYQLKRFADGMPGGFFIYRADGNQEIIYANEAMIRIFNCNTIEEFQEFTGNSFKGIVHPDDLEAVEGSIKEQIAGSQYNLDYVEYRIIQKGGAIRWIEDYGHFVRSKAAGDVFYVFVVDVTEKKELLQSRIAKYDKELKVVHQEYLCGLEMIEGLSVDYESIFHVNLDADQITAYRVSSRFEKQFPKGQPTCKFTGFDTDYTRVWVYPDDRELLSYVTKPEFIRKELSKHRTFHVNYRVFKEGKPMYIQLRVVNVSGEEHVSQIVMGYRNIDDEIIQEIRQKQILTDALHQANLANNAKNMFLSNMSHDIRTPMNAIVSFASLARECLADKEKVAGYLDKILYSSDQLLQLLNDILEISRIESGKIQVEEQKCSLMEMMHQVQMDMLAKAAAKNISLFVDVTALENDAVYADPQKLGQVLSYLVDNSIKYTKVGGRVTILVTEEKTQQDNRAIYHLAVEDNGIGISQDFLGHAFEPFEREKNTTLSGIYGTGLGLTIAKNLVEMMGGNLEASSVVGEGSRFTITVTLRQQECQSMFLDDVDEIPIEFSSPKRILVVDDNEINLEIEYEVLKSAGFLVDTATDGSFAVNKVRQSAPGDYDLILMDIQMPIMNGYQATRAIRAIEDPALAGIPIIAVSANTFDEDKKMAIESGMNAHLAKPLDTMRLYRLIRKFISSEKPDTSIRGGK